MKSFVTAIMPTTARRRRFIPEAIVLFQQQTWPARELVIVGEDDIADLIPDDPAIRFFACDPFHVTIGAKRNFACKEARGEIILHWDDDDWYRADRIEIQARALLAEPWADVSGESSLLFYDEQTGKVWRYRGRTEYVIGTSLCYRKSYWQRYPFKSVQVQEDNFFVGEARARQKLLALATKDDFIVARIHAGCTSPKLAARLQWWEQPSSALPPGFPRSVK